MRHGATVLVFPAWRSNPYLNILSLSARAAGYQFDGVIDFDEFLTRARKTSAGDVIHLHWTSPIAQSADSAREARKRMTRLRRMLDGAKHRGVRLVWTVHNRLPHEMRHRDEEIALYRYLAATADSVHIMTPDTPAVLSDVCDIDPSRVAILPHPSYEGIYDATITRTQARASFGLTDDEYAVLFIGQIRPYKGVSALIDAAARATPPGKKIVLLLGGYASPDAVAEIIAAIPSHVRTVLHLEHVPDGDITRWFRAADVAVFPYLQVLNSGSIHLAATFDVPAIIPDEPHLRTQFGDQPWVAFFTTDRPVESIAAILSTPKKFDDVTSADFDRYNEDLSPWSISVRYERMLDDLTGRKAAGPTAGLALVR